MKVKGASKGIGTTQTLGGRIRAVRKAWGWTQEKLAQALKTDRQIVSYWERDKSKPSRPAMQLLTGLFQLPPDALITGAGFTVPDLPMDLEKVGTTALLDLLPSPKVGKVQFLIAESEKAKAVSFDQALQSLKRAQLAGRAVWLVVSEE